MNSRSDLVVFFLSFGHLDSDFSASDTRLGQTVEVEIDMIVMDQSRMGLVESCGELRWVEVLLAG